MKRSNAATVFVLAIVSIISACSVTKNSKANQAKPYSPVSKELYDTISYMDSVLFTAFNNRDLDKLKNLFAGNLEVFQDNTGVRNYQQTIEAFKGLFSMDYILTRTLIKESMEVYPVKDYGAIQTGQHSFCHIENGKPECGIFKFLHIWQKKDGNWQITRIVTYNH